MNDTLISKEFAEILKADSDFAGLFSGPPATEGGDPVINIFGDVSGGVATARPMLTISGLFDPYGSRRKGDLSLEIRYRVADAETYEGLFDSLWVKLLGAQGADDAETRSNMALAKSAVQSEIALRGKAEVITYGPSPSAVTAEVDGDDIRMVLGLRLAWAFLPV